RRWLVAGFGGSLLFLRVPGQGNGAFSAACDHRLWISISRWAQLFTGFPESLAVVDSCCRVSRGTNAGVTWACPSCWGAGGACSAYGADDSLRISAPPGLAIWVVLVLRHTTGYGNSAMAILAAFLRLRSHRSAGVANRQALADRRDFIFVGCGISGAC